MAEEKYNTDELVPPSFMTEAYILHLLRQVEHDPELHVNIIINIKQFHWHSSIYSSILLLYPAH